MSFKLKEGDSCPKCYVAFLDYTNYEGCSCHINPPCANCVEAPLSCPDCGWEQEDKNHDD